MQRRHFLSLTGAAAALASIRTSFAHQLEATQVATAGADRFRKMRSWYLLDDSVVYLNHASIGTVPQAVVQAYQGYLEVYESNPWLYQWSDGWTEGIEKTRSAMADFIGCRNQEVAVTHNTTEGFNILAGGLPLAPGDEVLFSSLNHTGASLCWYHQARRRGFQVRRFPFPVERASELTADEMLRIYGDQISNRTRVLVFPEIDNVVGIRYPVKRLAALARSKGVRYIAVDAAQAVGMIPVNVAEMGIDFYSGSPHKWLQAPKGVGVFFLRKEVQPDLPPMWVTWGQDRWTGTARIFADYGTRDIAQVLALGDAIDFHLRVPMADRIARLKELRSYTMERVDASQHLTWRSPRDEQLGTSLYAVEVRGQDSREVSQRLLEGHGFVFRAFRSLGLNTIRLSPNIFNTREEIDRFVELTAG